MKNHHLAGNGEGAGPKAPLRRITRPQAADLQAWACKLFPCGDYVDALKYTPAGGGLQGEADKKPPPESGGGRMDACRDQTGTRRTWPT